MGELHPKPTLDECIHADSYNIGSEPQPALTSPQVGLCSAIVIIVLSSVIAGSAAYLLKSHLNQYHQQQTSLLQNYFLSS